MLFCQLNLATWPDLKKSPKMHFRWLNPLAISTYGEKPRAQLARRAARESWFTAEAAEDRRGNRSLFPASDLTHPPRFSAPLSAVGGDSFLWQLPGKLAQPAKIERDTDCCLSPVTCSGFSYRA